MNVLVRSKGCWNREKWKKYRNFLLLCWKFKSKINDNFLKESKRVKIEFIGIKGVFFIGNFELFNKDKGFFFL